MGWLVLNSNLYFGTDFGLQGGSHAFGNISLTDNIVRFETARYADNPLYVRGPGAGPEVTAGGIFGELLRLGKFLSVGA